MPQLQGSKVKLPPTPGTCTFPALSARTRARHRRFVEELPGKMAPLAADVEAAKVSSCWGDAPRCTALKWMRMLHPTRTYDTRLPCLCLLSTSTTIPLSPLPVETPALV